MGVHKRGSRGQERKVRRLLSGGETPNLIRLNTVSDIERYNMAKDSDRMNKYHKELERWQDDTLLMLRASLGTKSEKMGASIRATAYTDNYGIMNRLGFSFDRAAIYLHKGAGKNYGGFYGSKWTYIQQIRGVKIDTGIIRHTSPDSLGEQGSGRRTAFAWFDPIIKKQLPQLIDISLKYWDTMIVDATQIYIERP